MSDAKEKTEITSENFRKDVLNAIGKTNDFFEDLKFFSSAPCPDQYIGTEEEKYTLDEICETPPVFSEKTGSEGTFKKRITASPIELKTIILILESPHKYEFYKSDIGDHKKGDPIGPAQGKTGTAIRTFLLMLLGEKYKSYRLLLMNAIQFQCSLGVDTTIFRDDVFREVWDCGGKENFKGRLKKYLGTNPPEDVLIINACTQGNDNETPHYSLVEKAVKTVCDCVDRDRKIQYCRINHPASWIFCKFANFEEDSTSK